MSARAADGGRRSGRGTRRRVEPESWGITPYQLAMVTFAMLGVTAIAGLPTILSAYAGQEAWMAALLALPVGLLPLLPIYALERRRPGLTLVEHARAALGPVAGGLLSLVPIFFLLTVTPLGARQVDSLVLPQALPHTPQVVVAGLLIVVPLYAARQGPEVLARLAEALIPVALGTVFIVVLVTLRDVRVENLEPLAALGWRPLLQATSVAAAWYAETMLLGFLLPFGGRGLRDSWRGIAVGYGCVGLFLALATVWLLAVLGPLAGRVTFGVFQVTRVASIAEFLTHMDSLLVFAWTAGEFTRTGLWIYCLCLALSQCLGLSDYRPLTLPVAVVVVAGATSWFGSASEFRDWIFHVWPFFGLGFGIGSPLLVWLAVGVRDLLAERAHRGGPAPEPAGADGG